MTDMLTQSMRTTMDGIRAHEQRLMVAMSNLQKKDITATTPGGNPPLPQQITFKNVFDRETGITTIQVDRIIDAPAAFEESYEPDHVAADPKTGIVKRSPVNIYVEENNIRDAQRALKSITNAFVTTRNMVREKHSILGR